jgi:hypothetical protein
MYCHSSSGSWTRRCGVVLGARRVQQEAHSEGTGARQGALAFSLLLAALPGPSPLRLLRLLPHRPHRPLLTFMRVLKLNILLFTNRVLLCQFLWFFVALTIGLGAAIGGILGGVLSVCAGSNLLFSRLFVATGCLAGGGGSSGRNSGSSGSSDCSGARFAIPLYGALSVSTG